MLSMSQMTGFNAGGGDPYWGDVVLLMHMETTGFVDEVGHVVSNPGGGVITTAQAKAGTSSYMPTSGAGVYYPQLSSDSSNYAIGTGDVTIEAWVYVTNYTGDKRLFVPYPDTVPFFTEIQSGSGTLSGYSSGTIGGTGSAVPLNQWAHVAFVRKDGVVYAYLNGVQQWSASLTYNYTQTLWNPVYGVGAGYWYVDELRVTKRARYTADFTPPTASFPNS